MSKNTISIEYPPEQYPFRIKGWDKFQRYKFRNPPWIKLHVKMLQSEDWVLLDDSSRLLMIVLLLIAAQHEGFLPKVIMNGDYLKRVAHFSRKPKLKPLIECGFLVEMHTDAPTCTQPREKALQSTEYREDKKDISPKSAPSDQKRMSHSKAYPEDFEGFWLKYPDRRNNSKAEALKGWEGLSAGDRLAAVAALPAFTDYCRRNPDYRVVHCVRFLTQRRFDSWKERPAIQSEFRV